jgi:hypothetical protein
MYPYHPPYPIPVWAWRDQGLWGGFGESTSDAEADRHRGADLAGYRVEALDGSIGSVDKASYETDRSWLVVDTGPWIFGRKVLLPAGTVQHIDHAERKIYVDRSRRQIENSPGYDPTTFEDPDYRERVGRFFHDSYQSESARS